MRLPKTPVPSALLALSVSILLAAQTTVFCQGQKVRQPAVAGAFYPADPAELGKMVDGMLAQAGGEKLEGTLLALVSPHAGYVYSGQVAAHAYALLKGRKIERVVVISPCHIDAFPFAAVYDGEGYATPLGVIPVDTAFARELAAKHSLVKLSDRGHTEVQGRGEHALEVQLPFLQRALSAFKLVPIVMGGQSYEASRALGVALSKVIVGPGTLIVASSDLSHFHPYDEAVKLDRKVLTAIEEWDYLNMSQNFERRIWEACGGGPIVAAMMATERLGANRAMILKYANSGDVPGGDRSRVVGYGAVALVAEKSKRGAKAEGFSLSRAEKQELLKIAKRSVETAVRERQLYQCSSGGFEALEQDRGAFVTLKKSGQLRGCIGYVAPMKPLCDTVRDVAAFAALKDQRFPPVTTGELNKLEYEVSVLSPLRRMTDMRQIQIGRHGLVIKKGEFEGLLLPQVATEQHWDRKTFLEQTCVKAGLPPQAWQDEEADVFLFSAIVFGEQEMPAPQPFIPPTAVLRPGQCCQQEPPGPGLPPP